MSEVQDAVFMKPGSTVTRPVSLSKAETTTPSLPATAGNDGVVVSALLKETGLVTVDPGFMNTASCTSDITYIDGDQGILLYRGYPIEQLAENSSFLEVAYLLIHGELPKYDQLLDRVAAVGQDALVAVD